jgi:hypothetical protein
MSIAPLDLHWWGVRVHLVLEPVYCAAHVAAQTSGPKALAQGLGLALGIGLRCDVLVAVHVHLLTVALTQWHVALLTRSSSWGPGGEKMKVCFSEPEISKKKHPPASVGAPPPPQRPPHTPQRPLIARATACVLYQRLLAAAFFAILAFRIPTRRCSVCNKPGHETTLADDGKRALLICWPQSHSKA